MKRGKQLARHANRQPSTRRDCRRRHWRVVGGHCSAAARPCGRCEAVYLQVVFMLGVCANHYRFTNPRALHRKSALRFTSNPTPMDSCDDWDFPRRTTAARKLSMYDETRIRPVTREMSRLILGIGDRLQPAGRGVKLERCPKPGRSVSFRKSSTSVESQDLTLYSI